VPYFLSRPARVHLPHLFVSNVGVFFQPAQPGYCCQCLRNAFASSPRFWLSFTFGTPKFRSYKAIPFLLACPARSFFSPPTTTRSVFHCPFPEPLFFCRNSRFSRFLLSFRSPCDKLFFPRAAVSPLRAELAPFSVSEPTAQLDIPGPPHPKVVAQAVVFFFVLSPHQVFSCRYK